MHSWHAVVLYMVLNSYTAIKEKTEEQSHILQIKEYIFLGFLCYYKKCQVPVFYFAKLLVEHTVCKNDPVQTKKNGKTLMANMYGQDTVLRPVTLTKSHSNKQVL